MFRRLFCLFVAFTALLCMSMPAFATGVMPGGVGIPVQGNINLDVVDFFDYIRDDLRYDWNSVRHWFDEDVCPYAPQAGGEHKFQPVRTLKDGQVGLYYQCEYCGQSYGEALEEAYQEYVETLPGTRYNSDGAFIWSPGAVDFVGSSVVFYYQVAANSSAVQSGSKQILLTSAFPSCSFSAQNGSTWSASGTALAYIGDFVHLDLRHRNSYDYNYSRFWIDWGTVVIPMNGIYTLLGGSGCSISGSAFEAGVQVHLGAGASVSPYIPTTAEDFSHDFLWPSFEVELYTGGSGGNTYDVLTRVGGSVDNNGLYGYVEDGQLYQSSVGAIYNETSNVYQNPVTGDTSSVTSWEYDYSDRSYTLTTDDSQTIMVTYGDEAVTINEGGTTYNVYYLMEETDEIREELESVCVHDYSSTLTTPPTCTASGVRTFVCNNCGASYTQTVQATGHDYASAVTMAPTCVNTGVRTFTCSRCGDSYTVSIASTGHTWETVRTVPTTYDNDTGQLVQQGYTLYECSVCHEQYRIDADSGGSSLPAPSSGGTSTDSAGLMELDSDVGKGFLATIAHGLTEDLPAVLKAASEWFTAFPEFYGGFTCFMKDGIAGCLPDEPRTMMGFGMGMVTVIGIVKKIIGR